MSTYLFDQAWRQEHDRLHALEALFDDASAHHLARLGVGPGWRCLEVGAGAGGVARWLADRVGPSGQVLATDQTRASWTATAAPTSRCASTTS